MIECSGKVKTQTSFRPVFPLLLRFPLCQHPHYCASIGLMFVFLRGVFCSLVGFFFQARYEMVNENQTILTIYSALLANKVY